MRGASGVGDDGFDIAQIGGDRQNFGLVDDRKSVGAQFLGRAALDGKAQHRAAQAFAHGVLLAHGQRVLRVAGQTWVEHAIDARVCL